MGYKNYYVYNLIITKLLVAKKALNRCKISFANGENHKMLNILPRENVHGTLITVLISHLQNPDTPGINGWHWEVAITYTDILADICLHGNSAEIQKLALMGVNRETADPFKRGFTSVPLPSAGLLDLAFFKAINEAKDGGNNNIKMSHVTRKPVFGVCDQVRLKPACSAVETS